jgi:hypothetical protein
VHVGLARRRIAIVSPDAGVALRSVAAAHPACNRESGGDTMDKDRLLAFSDGVLAIIITIMVLELKVPHGAEWSALTKLVPVFLSNVLSFVYIAIY